MVNTDAAEAAMRAMCLGALRELCEAARDFSPDATHVVVNESDQGDHMMFSQLLDANGTDLDGDMAFDDDGAASMLSGDGWASAWMLQRGVEVVQHDRHDTVARIDVATVLSTPVGSDHASATWEVDVFEHEDVDLNDPIAVARAAYDTITGHQMLPVLSVRCADGSTHNVDIEEVGT